MARTDEEDCLFAVQLVGAPVMPFVFHAILELNVLEIISEAGEAAQLSPVEIASHLPTQNADAPIVLDRMLRLLANHSVLTCSTVPLEDGRVERRYGLTSVCKYFVKNEDGVSFFPWMSLFHDKVQMPIWHTIKDAVLDGGNPFQKAYGMNLFEYAGKNPEYSHLFNVAMFNHSTIIMKKILEVYKGFENLKEVVDVGGGIGTTSNIIISKYPAIKCINFDLPTVIDTAPPRQGIKHIGGDMFVRIPRGEAIFMKAVLHSWDDASCLKILKNCYEALPDHGVLIVQDLVVPSGIETNNRGKGISQLDVVIMTICEGGKERTEKEFETLGKGAGFDHVNLVCSVCNYGIMEFHK